MADFDLYTNKTNYHNAKTEKNSRNFERLCLNNACLKNIGFGTATVLAGERILCRNNTSRDKEIACVIFVEWKCKGGRDDHV